MQKVQDSVFSIVKTTSLSPAVFNYLQPTDDFPDKTPLGGILSDTKHGWLALGPKFCVVDLRTGLKIAQRTFGTTLSNFRTTVTSVVELPTPLTNNSTQLLISLECEDIAGIICVFHINGSQILRCIKTEVVVTQLAICDGFPDGPFTCFDGAVMAGTKSGEIFIFDLNRSGLIQALKDSAQGYENMIRDEEHSANITFLPLNAIQQIETQRDLALENDDHIAVLLNENSIVDGQMYIFRNPDGTVRMKARRDHVRVTVIQYIPQLGSLAVGFNFGAFQIWNLLNLDLEYTSQVNVECLPVTHFGFQEPCDDPRAFCYLWVVFSVLDRFDEEEFPLAVMYSLTYQGKRMLSDTKCLYQEFLTATIRFQIELNTTEEDTQLIGGRCVSCHTYSVNSMLGGEGEESMLNICQLVWECWGENANSSSQYGMLLFDLDQWYKDQMPATWPLQSNAFMSATRCTELARGATATLDVRLQPTSVCVYCAATRLEEHFYPNSLRYDCICLNTSESCILSTTGIQRQIINSLEEVGPTALLNPTRLYHACLQTGLVPLYMDNSATSDQEEQRRYLLSVALEARLSRFLKRCAHDWATGSHIGAGCTLTFLVDWCWHRAVELKENARELTAPLFTSSALPDRNVTRCLEHCVQQLTQLTGLLDAVLTKCCNLLVPDALSEVEEKYKGVGTVSLYFQVVQWFLRVGLLPERQDACDSLPYPGRQLVSTYNKRRIKLHRLQDQNMGDENAAKKSCSLLYIDQLIEEEFGGERIHQMWLRGGSECNGLYPPPSLYSLLRLYLLPDIAEEHKHSLVLYLLVDYSMVYDEVRYEAVIRRLMQFPTMFGLSNTAIKATQAFWHLDHRDFDFALDQLQCLTGNTLSEWQHHVVLSSLLAQKKMQAALQYLHVRKPAPVQAADLNTSKVNENDKLEDWQCCCNLYVARGLVFEALDVIRMCAHHARTKEDKALVLNYFFNSCRNFGQLAKLLQVTMLPYEEETFVRYLENCNESQTSDILIMYYLQQARYLEAEQYNNRIKQSKPRAKDVTASIESLTDLMDRETTRDMIVEVACSNLPAITNTVAHTVCDKEWDGYIVAPKPMSVFIQAQSPKNTFVYKSSFIQDSIENASETWINRPKARKGLKRALNIDETPFICTPKLFKNRSIYNIDESSESTPPKRPRLDFTGTPKTPRSAVKHEKISEQLSILLDMPEVQSPDFKLYDRRGADTPHSILKTRGEGRDVPVSPVDSRYLGESDDELLETASNHTHYSDSTNKHLRFTIPTASESGSTPSPIHTTIRETEIPSSAQKERDVDMSLDSFVTTESHIMTEPNPLESPPKKLATAEKVQSRKSYKDSVRARRSLSISANSSLSEDPNTSIESIADIPVTLINVRYSDRRRSFSKERDSTESIKEERSSEPPREATSQLEVPKTPTGRRSIRAVGGESTPLLSRSRSVTPERMDSPTITTILTPLRSVRSTRSRSRTPDISPRSSPLAVIQELPKQEVEVEPHPDKTMLSVPRRHRSRSRTPERTEKAVESPRLEAITESPTKSPERPSSPVRRSLRSRSRTPELEPKKTANEGSLSPRTLRSRAKTPEKPMSPKKDAPKSVKKPLSRLVLEANALAASKNLEKQLESKEENTESVIECTPMKSLKHVPSLMDVTISPIASKSVLQSPNETIFSESAARENKTAEDSIIEMKSLPAFTINETKFGKSVLHSYESSVEETSTTKTSVQVTTTKVEQKSVAAFTLSESYFEKSVLQSYESSVDNDSSMQQEKENNKEKELKFSETHSGSIGSNFGKSVLGSSGTSAADSHSKKDNVKDLSSLITDDSEMEESDKGKDVIQKEKEKIVEIEREIIEIEEDMSEVDDSDMSHASEDSSKNEEEEEVEEEIPPDVVEEEHRIIYNEDDTDDSSGAEDTTTYESESDANASEEEIISITDSNESSEKLEIDIQPKEKEFMEMKDDRKASDKEEDSNEATDRMKSVEGSSDPLNQAQMSVLTEDNSNQSENILAEDSKLIKEDLKNASVQEEDSSEATDRMKSVKGSSDPLNQAQMSVLTEDNSNQSESILAEDSKLIKEDLKKSSVQEEDSNEATDRMKSVEGSSDPLNQAQMSILTEDNSIPSESNINKDLKLMKEDSNEATKNSTNPLDQAQISLLTDDNSMRSEKSEGYLNYSGENEGLEIKKGNDNEEVTPGDVEMKAVPEISKQILVAVESQSVETKPTETIGNIKVNEQIVNPQENPVDAVDAASTPALSNLQKSDTTGVSTVQASAPKSPTGESKSEDTASEDVKQPASRSKRRVRSTSSVKSNKSHKDDDIEFEIRESNEKHVPQVAKSKSPESESKSEGTTSEDVKQPASRSKRRVRSTSSVKSNKSHKDDDMDVEISESSEKNVPKAFKSKSPETESKSEDTASEDVAKPAPRTRRRVKSTSSVQSNKSNKDASEVNIGSKSPQTISEVAEKPTPRTRRRVKSTFSAKSVEIEMSDPKAKGDVLQNDVKVKSPETESKSEDTASEDAEKSMLRTKKRTRSTSSAKFNIDEEDTPKPRTPITRKRSQSVSSNKSVPEEQKTLEDTKAETPSRLAKNPSDSVRTILTRRASKELNQSQKFEESQADDVNLTPKKRSTRSRNKDVDDNASVASDTSVKSRGSKVGEDGDSKAVRKGKKLVAPVVKPPDLSVIPESTEEAKNLKNEILNEYSRARRMTRHQKSLLESWLEPSSSPCGPSRASVTSRASDQDDDDASSTHSTAFDVQPIDRISLLNKGDFEGSPDPSEALSNISPESIASDASKQRRSQRAASEARSTPKSKPRRRISVDLAAIRQISQSPATPRGRRASFNRACEALHTPKGRRVSTDIKKGDADSVTSSSPVSEADAATTPLRRGRRLSTQSNASLSKAEASAVKRSRKLSAVDENKDNKE